MCVFTGIFLAIISGLPFTGSSNVKFFEISCNERFTGLVLDSGFIKQTRRAGNDKSSCGAICLSMADCASFFVDTSTNQCQFHDSVLQDTIGLTMSPNSLYFYVGTGGSQDIVVCPADWVSYQNVCFFFEKSSMTSYAGAKAVCEGLGGKVMRIDTSDENEFIRQHILSITFVSHGFWLGLTDQSNPGTWVWDDTGNEPIYNDWELSQPQNNDEHCAVIQRWNWHWHDVVCSDMVHPACRIG